MLKLIRRHLESGIMQNGLIEPRSEGTPQGGPLSPLPLNTLRDDLDKELERRGHTLCRYADDCNIYAGSQRAGERVIQSLSRFVRAELKLTVNPKRSAGDRPWKRNFLGFSMTAQRECRVRVAPRAVKRFEEALGESFRAGRGRNLRAFLNSLKPKLRGWASYCSVAETRNVFEDFDQWLRRKLALSGGNGRKPPTRMPQANLTFSTGVEIQEFSDFSGTKKCEFLKKSVMFVRLGRAKS